MNHVYRLVWSHRRNGWVAVSELARGRKKGSGRRLTLAALSLTAAVAQAGPSGGQVVSGTGQISSSGNTTTVTQSSQNLSLNWQAFNIAPQETVDFVQQSTTAVAVNHILGNSGSQILGHLNANGQVYLINPNGILFGAGSQVDVGGLVASTLEANAPNSSSNTRSFSGSGTGSVVNEGTITAANGGYVVLLGNKVSNVGTIVAQLGTVGLGAGSAVTLTFSGDSLVGMQVDHSTLNNLAANGGLVQADGGRVIMTAGAQNALLASVVNNTGVIEARTAEDHDGTITLLGGMTAGQVNVGGTLDASAPNGGNGGAIETSAAHVSVADNAVVTTAAAKGLTGSWTVDPQDFTVAASGGDITGSTLSGELATTNVQLESSSGATAGSGNVNVNDPVTWSANTTLKLTASNNVNINANITATGATAGLVIAPNTANGSEAASGTGVYTLNNGSSITLSGANPTLSIAGNAYTVINSLGAAGSTTGTDLQGINGNLSGYYALGSNIDASPTASWNSGAGFAPLGQASSFSGTFDGLGHTISGLTVNTPFSRYVGLFGTTSSTAIVQNVGLIGGSVNGNTSTGALVGRSYGTINNSYATSTVSGNFYVGGLAGLNYGTISNSHATGAVTDAGYGTGGLVGANGTNTHPFGNIYNSYATGAVSATTALVGGLAGLSYGTIANSYATGSATSLGSNRAETGGLVGAMGGGTVTNSYSTGAVSAQYQDGGLVGIIYGGSVANSYWDTTTSGMASSAGGTGLTTPEMQTASNFASFNFTTTPGATGNAWVMVDGDGTLNNAGGAAGVTFPMLASEYATNITNAHQLQLIAMAPAANYSLGADIDASATAGLNDIWSTSVGFSPVGAGGGAFSGTFDGMGHVISGLNIVTSSPTASGMFGSSTGTIENVGLVNENLSAGTGQSGGLVGNNSGTISNSYVTGSVSAGNYAGGLVGINAGTITNSYSTATVNGAAKVGGLVGVNYGTITGSYATGAVSGTGTVGGLVGANYGTVSDGYATGTVTGSSGSYLIGGLVGGNYDTITNSYATGAVSGVGASDVGGLVGYSYGGNITAATVSDSYATGAVSGAINVGGLVGYNFAGPNGTSATIVNSYATGAVTGQTGAFNVGGLVGYNYAGAPAAANTVVATVSNSYSTGAVIVGTGSANVGGLVGNNVAGALGASATVTGSFWNQTTSGQTTSAGGTGLTTLQMLQQSSFSGWDFTGTWISYSGYTNPLLRSFMTPLTVTASDATTTYSGLAYSGGNGVTYSATPSGNLLGSVTYGGSAQGAVNAGSYTLTPQGLYSNQQGYIISYVGGTFTVNPADLTITADSASKIYGAALPAFGVSYSGFVNNETAANLTTQPTISTAATAGSNVGGYAIVPSGAVDSNYTISYVNGSLAVNPADLTITANGTSKVYGAALPTFGVSYSGLVNNDTAASLTTQPSLSTTATAGSNVGGYAIVPSGAADSNYTISYVNGSLAVNPADLTITANSTSKVYGAALPTFGVSYSGLVNNDTAASLTTQPALSTAATAGSNVGGYAIVPSGAVDSNYTISYVNGSLAVTPADLTITANNASKVYGAALPALGVSYSGLVNNDTAASLTTQPLTSTTATAGSNVGGYAIVPSGAADSNYTITYANGTLTVNPATLTVSGTTVANKVYDGATTASLSGGTLSGIVGSDSVTLMQSGAFASANAGTGVAVNASDNLGGSAAGNYTLTQPTGLSANITPATLTVNGTSVANKVYDGTTAATLSGGTLSGIIGSDAVSLTQSGAFASANAGTGVAVNSSDALSGAGAGNYTLAQPTGLSANITPATLTYVALPNSTTAGKPASGLSGTVSGFVTGDTLADSASGTELWTTDATAASSPGSYAIDGGGLTSGNYVFTQAAGNATALTVGAAITPPPTQVAFTTPPSVAWLEGSILASAGNTTPLTFDAPQNPDEPVSGPAPVGGTSDTSNIAAGIWAGYSQVPESITDLGGGKLHIESGGVRLPDGSPGAH